MALCEITQNGKCINDLTRALLRHTEQAKTQGTACRLGPFSAVTVVPCFTAQHTHIHTARFFLFLLSSPLIHTGAGAVRVSTNCHTADHFICPPCRHADPTPFDRTLTSARFSWERSRREIAREKERERET